MMETTTWQVDLFNESEEQKIAGILAGGDRLYVLGVQGGLSVLSTETGETLTHIDTPVPVWDGMAATKDAIYLTTRDGRVLRLSSLGE